MRSASWTFVAILALLLAVDLALWVWAGVGHPEILEENNLVENLQAVFLALALIFFCLRAIHSDETRYRLLFFTLGLVCLTFFVGELDTGGHERVYPFLSLFKPPLRTYWLIAAWLGMLLLVLVNGREVLPLLFRWFASLAGLLFLLGLVCYGASEASAQGLWGLPLAAPVLLQEALELNGALLLVLAALFAGRRGGASA